jgi:SpoVK/Ycf46/Vps4 family AAA+-type ATPase
MGSRTEGVRKFAIDLAIGIAVSFVVTYGVTKAISLLSGSPSVKKQKQLLIERLGKPELKDIDFDSYEAALFDCIVAHSEVDVSFEDVGGMDDVVERIVDNVCVPIQAFKQFAMAGSRMASCPTGILLCEF